MNRINYNIPVEEWKDFLEKEKKHIMMLNDIKVTSPSSYWTKREVSVDMNDYFNHEHGDNYLFEFLVNDKVRGLIYVRRNDGNTIDMISIDL